MSLRERYPTSRESLSTASRPTWFRDALPSASKTESSGPTIRSSVKGRMSSLTRRSIRCSAGTACTCCTLAIPRTVPPSTTGKLVT